MRAILYVRVSRGDNQDPQTQLGALRQWAAVRGWCIAGEQVDEITGDPARRRRPPPGITKAFEAIERKRAEVLAIWAADRLVRSPWDLLQLVQRVQLAGGRVASLHDGGDLDTTTDTGELLLFLRGWYARMELRLTRARTVAGLARARAAGKRIGRPPAVLPDLDQVRQLHATGLGARRIAEALGSSYHCTRAALSRLGLAIAPPRAAREREAP